MPCYKATRKGERRRKSVRGCIVGPDIASLSLVIVKRGETDLPNLTDTEVPRRLGPKRVDKIRKMFNLGKADDPRDYVVRRKVTTKSGKKIIKKPKIQRLITPNILRRRKFMKAKSSKRRAAAYEKRKEYFARLCKKARVIQRKKMAVRKAVEKQFEDEKEEKKQHVPPQKKSKGQQGKKKQKKSQKGKGKKQNKKQKGKKK